MTAVAVEKMDGISVQPTEVKGTAEHDKAIRCDIPHAGDKAHLGVEAALGGVSVSATASATSRVEPCFVA
jgi:hypothetical protein